MAMQLLEFFPFITCSICMYVKLKGSELLLFGWMVSLNIYFRAGRDFQVIKSSSHLWNEGSKQEISSWRGSGPVTPKCATMFVTEGEVELLAAQKPVKRQGWQKVGFILEAGNLGRRADTCPKANRGARAFIHGGRDYMQKQCGQLWQTSWNWWSNQRHLVFLFSFIFCWSAIDLLLCCAF